MTDCFALLAEPRRPWLDTEALKRKFLTLSASAHPDKIQDADETARAAAARSFAELNAAYHCLAEPKSRLLHLLELELGARPKDIQEIPAALADLFAEVAMTCRQADGFLAEKSKVTSPLLQVQGFERSQAWIEKLEALRKKLDGLRGRLLEELKAADEQWMGAETGGRGDALAKLEELYRLFSYFNRWHKQIQERALQLMM
jgi:curved DNA-binding protein CbpA